MCGGYAQANLCILPKDYAFDFLLFCMRNPKPCPILEVGDVGSRVIRTMADGGDICRDIPKYRIWRNGVLEREVTDISAFWQEDFVYFLIGCSFSFESELLEAERADVQHQYRTQPGGQISRQHGRLHAPDPRRAGGQGGQRDSGNAESPRLTDTYRFARGDRHQGHYETRLRRQRDDGETPVFWACGVTPQNAVMQSKPPIAITHSPGHMFITDVKNSALKY